MTRTASISLVCCAVLSLVACDEESASLNVAATWIACSGRPTACTTAPLASESEYVITTEAYELNIDCEVRSGPGDSYVVDFEIEVQGGNGPGLYGQELEFQSSATQPAQVRGCGEFAINEGGNEFPTTVCNSVNAGEGSGGGCEVRIGIEGNIVRGEFMCQELVLPGNPNTVMSTIHEGTVGWGNFVIENCHLRV